ncbi:haloacid dehalogenase type II [Pelagivirga sediminicola]|uniref:(S)-2-haloacid dehalogenase n=1 Tax=Pelagivirga sediminicola TaxID=2170575 RepID=A0A2T7G446_9RHOB|nr:haloacid dehalogenase type II [Pelagivirga sediminicola]PVA09178.1 haloacid dehalogenase type II [Pelagivirga sediminicola]
MAITTCIFDAYGTLFDVSAAARIAAAEPGQDRLAECWPQIARDWRLRQLHYSWLRTIMQDRADFWQITCDALDWTLEAHGIEDAALRARLLALYHELAAYPEAKAVLAALKEAGLNTAILSNGTPEMLNAAVASAGIGPLLDDVLSAEMCGIFKPARAVYDMAPRRFACAPGQVLFVTSNGWDAAGAAAYGFTVAWVNRDGAPVERLPGRPAHVLRDLRGVPDCASL